MNRHSQVIPVLIGPFPGEFQGGVSILNAKLATMLAVRGIAHECINLSSDREVRDFGYHRTRFKRAIAGFWRIVLAPGGNRRRYDMSLDGGGGLVYNILLAAAARLRRAPLFLYHHSTRYILADSFLMKLLLLVAGSKPAHIACSKQMFELFRERYRVSGELLVVSNAAWIAPSTIAQSPPNSERVTLGYLGVLTEEKGVLRALDTFREVRRRGVRAQICIAGGAAFPLVRNEIEKAQSEFGADFIFLGKIYGPEKWEYFAGLDYFLFPTLYPHETQSSVAPEAMSAGVPVIAYDHRFVGELVKPDGGLLIPTTSSFAPAAADWIVTGADVAERLERRKRVRAHYAKIYGETAMQIETLIERLAAPN